MSIKDFQLLSKLGEGAFSSVWKVKRISDGQEYAMKKVKLTPLSEKEKQNAINEVRILASIHSPYIAGYKEAFFEDTPLTLCIVMEYAGGGDILNKITQHQKSNTFFKEKDIWRFATQMIMGLKTLHDMKILHRDLKCANVFLSTDGKTAKLGDLNVSKVAKNNLVYTQTGTPYYASPEVWRDQPYDMKSDIWSLGCVIYEMCALKPPFRANDMQGLYKKIQRGVFDRIPSQYSLDLYNLISTCLQVKPSARPTCDQLLSHPLILRNGAEFIQDLDSQEDTNNELLGTILVPKNIKAIAQKLPKANYNNNNGALDSEKGRGAGSKTTLEDVQSRRPTSQRIPSHQNEIIVRESQSRESRASRMQKIDNAIAKEVEKDYLVRIQKEYRAAKPLEQPQRSPNVEDLGIQKKSPPNYRILSGRRVIENPNPRDYIDPNRRNDVYDGVSPNYSKPKVIDPIRRNNNGDVGGAERILVSKQEYLLNKYQSRPEEKVALPRIYSNKDDALLRKADDLLAKYQAIDPVRNNASPFGEKKVHGAPSRALKKETSDILDRYRNALDNRVGLNRADYDNLQPSSNKNIYNNQQDNYNNNRSPYAAPKKNIYGGIEGGESNWNHRKQTNIRVARPLWWG